MAPHTMMKLLHEGIVFSSRKDTGMQSCAFPGICVLPGGRWLCSFRTAPRKTPLEGQNAAVSWSDDEGETWSEPILPFIPPKIGGRPGLVRAAYMTSLGGSDVVAVICWVDDSNPGLPFFNEETEGLLDTRILISRSFDCGETWSEPEFVDTWPYRDPTPVTGPLLVFPDGEMACQFELNKRYFDDSTWRHKSVLLFSKDGGKSWHRSSTASSDPGNRYFYWDQRPSVGKDGGLLDFFWTFDRKRCVYLAIHARQSDNRGATWSEMWDTGVPGQPASPVFLPDGRIGMVYVDRTGEPTVKLRASADGGKSWPDSTVIVIYGAPTSPQTVEKNTMQDAWAEMGRFSLGLPATAILPNGDILAVFYAGASFDSTGIRWARIGEN